MIYSEDNIAICYAGPLEWYRQWRDEKGGEGFRTISLSLAGSSSEPIYTAVMARLDRPFNGRSYAHLSHDQLMDEKIPEAAAASPPLYPYIVTATGYGSHTVYAAAFRPMTTPTIVRADMNAQQFRTAMAEQRAAGRMPIWIDSFGTAQDIRYCAVWGDNRDNVAWNVETLNDRGDTLQERFDAVTSVGGRPALIAMTPDGGVAEMFVDTRLEHGWSSAADILTNRLYEIEEVEARAGRFPVRIGTTVASDGLRHSVIFAGGDEIVRRTFRKSGPNPLGLDTTNRAEAAKIDQWMERYVKAHGIRGAAVAVVDGTRLVFARGYTYAEPDYPDIEPTTLFRMASISKTFCAVLAWKALLDNEDWDRGDKIQDILQLRRTDGAPPQDPDFFDITVRHLLENNSGIDQGSARDIMIEQRDSPSKPPQPMDLAKVISMVVERDSGPPGGAADYGKTDYLLLGMVAARLAGAATFDLALKKLVLDRLQMTRTRGTKSKIEARSADEALHHTRDLATARSSVHDDRRLVPVQYGGENYDVFDGAGGVSSAVVDVARLCAMLSCRMNNPVLPASVLKTMLEEAAASESARGSKCHHGFDDATGSDPHFTLEKGGSLPGTGTGLRGTTGRRFVVIARNGEKAPDPPAPAPPLPYDWKTDLSAIADNVNWAGDLFPYFGMPSLGVSMQRPPVGRAGPKMKPLKPAR